MKCLGDPWPMTDRTPQHVLRIPPPPPTVAGDIALLSARPLPGRCCKWLRVLEVSGVVQVEPHLLQDVMQDNHRIAILT